MLPGHADCFHARLQAAANQSGVDASGAVKSPTFIKPFPEKPPAEAEAAAAAAAMETWTPPIFSPWPSRKDL